MFPKNLENDAAMKLYELYPLLRNDGHSSNWLPTSGAVAALRAEIYGRTVMV